ncbi:phytoene desaturase family protein [Rubellicoccus peritrichatus]|uniref:Phytoene desaturase family protein n=1 Tax=Rubellicoccus peritrichatus TaxID=3080537 RepID=A0AAQ3L6L1_9BACT|nr:phytoene desaturase family protein [Puniceicoccus sp. CR14]WOO39951.1 phytoene desaturase family protein [Puniceicoccus sp. CR14]
MGSREKKAIVIGGGLGGLSAAIYLAAKGLDVQLLEKNEHLGGKANRLSWNNFHFDTGPSLLTMPFVLREVFEAAGRKMEDYLELIRVRPACRYFFHDKQIFDAPGDLSAMREAIKEAFPDDLEGFDSFVRDGRRLWEVSGPAFLFNRMELETLFKINPLKGLAGLGALRKETLGQSLNRYFKEPHLIQLFSRYATYNGSDPSKTPATFNVISYVEMAFGSWHVKGGIYAMVEALAKLANELGVEISTDSPVARIRFSEGHKSVAGVIMESGEIIDSNNVLVNADAATALQGPLMADHPQSKKWQEDWCRREASSSGYVLLLAMDSENTSLACHNIFFRKDYAREFTELFDQPKPLTCPTIYVSVPGKIDSTQAPPGKESWFVLVNAPSLTKTRDWENYSEGILEQMSDLVPGFNTETILWQNALPPTFLEKKYNAWKGSIYGPSSNDLRSAFFRVRNRGAARGLAFAGGSAHPGGGIPLVLTSGRLAAEIITNQ